MLWQKISFPDLNEDGYDLKLSDYGLTRKDVGGFIKHFQVCKDCAADHAFLMATQDDENNDVLRLSNVNFAVLTENDSDDDWGHFDLALLGEDNVELKPIFPVEMDDNIVLIDTKEWVRKGLNYALFSLLLLMILYFQ